MKTIPPRSWAKLARAFLGVAAMAAATCFTPAFASPPGAIYTSDVTGTIINENHYDLRIDVHLVGGPDSGQVPPGDYCIEVRAPDGTLLGKSNGAVNFPDNAVTIIQIWENVFKAFDDPVAGEFAGEIGYNLTTNNGGEYKVIISADCTFDGGTNKSDNFKVLEERPCPDCPGDEEILIGGRKYCDANGNGVVDGGEGGLAGWTINISWTGSAGGGGADSTTALTDADGNWTALIPFGATGLTVSEALQTGWAQTFPGGAGTYTEAGPIETSEGLTTLDFLNVRLSSICVTKFCDANGNGVRNDGEGGIAGWTMTLIGIDSLGNEVEISKNTSADGSVCFDDLLPGTYSVAESAATGWVATTADTKAFDILSASCAEVATPLTFSFGNVQTSRICATKFYDANGDGIQNNGEVGIAGWKMTLIGTDSKGNPVSLTGYTAGVEGKVCFSDLLPGTYTVTEGLSLTGNWVATTPTEQAADILSVPCDQAPADTAVSFGNACLAEGGGHTLGFWSNPNGRRVLEEVFGNLNNAWAFLTSLNLVNADGSPFAPTSYNAYRNWLLSASATNMAYMLSVQLAAMELNVRAGFVSADALVYNSCLTQLNPPLTNPDTIQDVMDAANAALLPPGNLSLAGDPDRAAQECLKTTLDDANNNLNFGFSPTPCEFSF